MRPGSYFKKEDLNTLMISKVRLEKAGGEEILKK